MWGNHKCKSFVHFYETLSLVGSGMMIYKSLGAKGNKQVECVVLRLVILLEMLQSVIGI